MNQTIGVNITPQSFQPTLHFSQGDVGRVFVVNVTDYDIPSGATVTCVATKPSGMGFTVSGTVSGNQITFTSTAEMTDEWGRFPAEIRIASGSTLLGTANFLMIGEKDPHPASTIDGTQEELIPQLTLLVNRVEVAAESVHDLTVSATTLAAGSDATATYDSTNNSIAFGIPRGADGDVTRSEFNDLKSDLAVFENGVSDSHNETVTADYHVYTFPESIEQGTKVKITNKSTTTTFSINFRKADGTSQTMSSGLAPGYSIEVTAPFRTVDMRCYCNNTDWNFTVEYGENALGRIEANEDAINEIVVRNSANDDWAIGTLVNGVYGANTKRITDKDYIPIFKGCKVTVIPLLYVIHYYDVNKNYISDTGWIAKGTTTTISNDAVYIRICAKVSDGYNFTNDDLVTYADCIDVEYPINKCIQFLRASQVDEDLKAEIYKNILLNSFNSAYHTGASSWATKCATYNQLFNDSEHIESFLFFTDPHFFTRVESVWQERMPEFIAEMQKYYNSTPTSFCLCGGDWLTASDSDNTALFRLGYIDGFMNAMFDNYYPMFGNHDDNYQGATVDGGTPATATPLDKQTIVNLWFKKFGKAYYTFEGTSTKFYVFDSGNDWNTNMSDYRWEQIDWFATSLLSDTSERIAVATHIAYNSAADYSSDTLTPMADYIGQVIQAYNNRSSITLNGETYNFSAVSGSIKFIIAGHLHDDGLKTAYGVPIILTIDTQHITTEPSFDLVYVDYDNDLISLIRIGSGSDRTVSLS